MTGAQLRWQETHFVWWQIITSSSIYFVYLSWNIRIPDHSHVWLISTFGSGFFFLLLRQWHWPSWSGRTGRVIWECGCGFPAPWRRERALPSIWSGRRCRLRCPELRLTLWALRGDTGPGRLRPAGERAAARRSWRKPGNKEIERFVCKDDKRLPQNSVEGCVQREPVTNVGISGSGDRSRKVFPRLQLCKIGHWNTNPTTLLPWHLS